MIASLNIIIMHKWLWGHITPPCFKWKAYTYFSQYDSKLYVWTNIFIMKPNDAMMLQKWIIENYNINMYGIKYTYITHIYSFNV